MEPLLSADDDDWYTPFTHRAWFPPAMSLPVPEVEWAPRDRLVGVLHLPNGISYELIDEGRPFGFARALEGYVDFNGDLFDEDES